MVAVGLWITLPCFCLCPQSGHISGWDSLEFPIPCTTTTRVILLRVGIGPRQVYSWTDCLWTLEEKNAFPPPYVYAGVSGLGWHESWSSICIPWGEKRIRVWEKEPRVYHLNLVDSAVPEAPKFPAESITSFILIKLVWVWILSLEAKCFQHTNLAI